MRYRMKFRQSRRKKPNLVGTLILIFLILFIAFNWILPGLVNGLGSLNRLFKPIKSSEQAPVTTLAPPVILIPYEATNSAKIDLSGYSTGNSIVKIYLDDEMIREINTDTDGSFTAQNVPLNFGTNNIYGKTVDQKGQESLASKTLKVIFDSEPPSLEVKEPEDGKTSQSQKIKVQGQVEPGATLYIDGQRTITNEDGSFSQEVSLKEGENSLTIKVHDLAGNITEVQKRVIYQP